MQAIVVSPAGVRHAIVSFGALSASILDLAVLAFLVATFISSDRKALLVISISSSELLIYVAFVRVRAHVVPVNLLALSIRDASVWEGATEVAAATIVASRSEIITAVSAERVLKRLSGLNLVDLLIASKDITNISGLHSNCILGSSTGSLFTLD